MAWNPLVVSGVFRNCRWSPRARLLGYHLFGLPQDRQAEMEASFNLLIEPGSSALLPFAVAISN